MRTGIAQHHHKSAIHGASAAELAGWQAGPSFGWKSQVNDASGPLASSHHLRGQASATVDRGVVCPVSGLITLSH